MKDGTNDGTSAWQDTVHDVKRDTPSSVFMVHAFTLLMYVDASGERREARDRNHGWVMGGALKYRKVRFEVL